VIKFWNSLTNLGIKEGMSILEVRTIRTVNAVSLVALPLILAAWVVRLSEGIIFNIYFNPLLFIFASFPILFNKYGKYETAKISQLLVTVIFMTTVSIQNFKIGLSNHPEVVLIGYSAVIILMYDGYKQILAFLFNFLSYLFILAYFIYFNGDEWNNFIPNSINSIAAFSVIYIVTTVYKKDYQTSQLQLLTKNIELETQAEKITQQASKLSALNDFKNQLFSIISHDMRGPLNSVNSYFQLMQSKDISKEEFDQLLPSLSNNVFKASDLMDNMLIWAKSQLKGQQIKIEQINVNNQIEEVLTLLKTQAKNKSLIISKKINEEYVINADKNMLALIIRNILTNSIKFSNIGGRIEIEFINNNHISTLKFSDNGIGISESELKTIFSEDSDHRDGTQLEAGTGLGLKFCKSFVEKMNGELTIESKQNVGTTITVILPHKIENPTTK
jgi:two-component system sensor histidine kinase/response regulator